MKAFVKLLNSVIRKAAVLSGGAVQAALGWFHRWPCPIVFVALVALVLGGNGGRWPEGFFPYGFIVLTLVAEWLVSRHKRD